MKQTVGETILSPLKSEGSLPIPEELFGSGGSSLRPVEEAFQQPQLPDVESVFNQQTVQTESSSSVLPDINEVFGRNSDSLPLIEQAFQQPQSSALPDVENVFSNKATSALPPVEQAFQSSASSSLPDVEIVFAGTNNDRLPSVENAFSAPKPSVFPKEEESSELNLSFESLAQNFDAKKAALSQAIFELVAKAGLNFSQQDVSGAVDSLGRAVKERVGRGKINLYDEAQALPLFDALRSLKGQEDKKEDYERLNDVLKKNGLTEEMIETFRGDTMMTVEDESNLQAYINGTKKDSVLIMYQGFINKLEAVGKTEDGRYDLSKLSPLELYMLSLAASRMADQTKDESDRVKFEAQIVTEKTLVDKAMLAREAFAKLSEVEKKKLSELMERKNNGEVFNLEDQALWDLHQDILEVGKEGKGNVGNNHEVNPEFEKMTDAEKLKYLVEEANKLGVLIVDEGSYAKYSQKFAKYYVLSNHLIQKMAKDNLLKPKPTEEELLREIDRLLEENQIIIPQLLNFATNPEKVEEFNKEIRDYDKYLEITYAGKIMSEFMNEEVKKLKAESTEVKPAAPQAQETAEIKKQRRIITKGRAAAIAVLVGIGVVAGILASQGKSAETPEEKHPAATQPVSTPENPFADKFFFSPTPGVPSNPNQKQPSFRIPMVDVPNPFMGAKGAGETSNPSRIPPTVDLSDLPPAGGKSTGETKNPSGTLEIKVGAEKGSAATGGDVIHLISQQVESLKNKKYQLLSQWNPVISSEYWNALALANGVKLGPKEMPWKHFNELQSGTVLKITPEVIKAAEKAMFK